ncbi:MAG: hypothetical protein FH748_11125 [Balneolaceae bacterium]|nr:hypothetical protein [Balneolaceae bacterium]
MIPYRTHLYFVLILLLCSAACPSLIYGQSDEKPSRIWNVKIEGNTSYSEVVIKNNISNEAPSVFEKLTFFDEDNYYVNETEIKRDVIRIERFYQRRGFNDVEVSYRFEQKNKGWKKALIFKVNEGTPIRIDSVRFFVSASPQDSLVIFNDETFNKTMGRLPYQKGKRYEPINAVHIEGELSRALKNLGYAYASAEVQAKVDTLSKLTQVAIINYPGPRARFDSIIVKGEETLDEQYITRETGIQKGAFFSEKQLRQAQREVFSHHLLRFAIVSIPEQQQDTTINVLIRVKEAPPRSVQLKFGAGNFTRFDGLQDAYKMFRAQATWIHRNVRGKGERFTASGKISAIEQRLSADYLFPYIYNTKSSIIVSPFAQHKLEPSYEIVRGGINNSLVYKYSRDLTGTFSYEFTLNNEIARRPQVQLPDSILSYNVSSFSANAYYTHGVRRGRDGWLVQPNLILSGLFGEASFSFQKVTLDARKYTPLTQDIVLAKRFRGGIIYYAAQDSLPSDIRIYNGGTNSVRGWNRLQLGPKRAVFDEEGVFDEYVSIGGRATFSFNTELRIRLNSIIKGLGVATFLDGGQVWRNVSDIGTVKLQYGAGAGLRYQSPIGPLRFDLAYKLNPTDKDLGIYNGEDYGRPWSRWAIHISIGQAF